MKKEQKLFQLYAGNERASNLSVAGGGVKLLSFLFLAGAVLYTLALALSGIRIATVGGIGTAFIFLMDELNDELLSAFLLWAAVIACRYAACVLQEKAKLLSQWGQAATAAEASQEAPPAP